MFKKATIVSIITFITVASFGLTGCTVIFQKGKRSDFEKITELKSQINDLANAKLQLEERLRDEIDDKQVRIDMLERGLVITFVAEVLYDSGKAKLRKDSYSKLDKVAGVINTTVRDLNIGIEGHTDNVPIKHSKWKSNWELSAARALSVVHYLINNHDVDPVRLSGTGFGEYHPVASNATKEGRQKNRRVEIVILPKADKDM